MQYVPGRNCIRFCQQGVDFIDREGFVVVCHVRFISYSARGVLCVCRGIICGGENARRELRAGQEA